MGKDRQARKAQDQVRQDAEESLPRTQEKAGQHRYEDLQGDGHLPDPDGDRNMDQGPHRHESRKKAAKSQMIVR